MPPLIIFNPMHARPDAPAGTRAESFGRRLPPGGWGVSRVAGEMARRRLDPRAANQKRAGWRCALRAAVAALAILLTLVPSPVAGQMIRGRVVDAQSGAAVELARVVVSGGRQRSSRMSTVTDGRFAFPLRRGGSYRVQVSRTGYGEGRRSVTVGPNDTVFVEVRVSANAHRLDPLTVTGRARRLKVLGRFYETPDTVLARVNVVGQRRSIRARGSFPTPHLCYHLSGNAHRVESVITLTVQARGNRELCQAVGGGFVYDVSVRRLPPGTYTVRVLYTFQDDVQEPAVVLDTTVAVQ